MASELRIIVFIVAALALAAWAVRSWAAEPPRGELRLTPPADAQAQLQTAAVRSLTGASVRAVSGF